MIQLKYMKD